jgi:hypothetical protein
MNRVSWRLMANFQIQRSTPDKAASVTFAIKQSVFIFRRQRDKRAPGPTSIRSSKNNRRGLILTFLPYQRPK